MGELGPSFLKGNNCFPVNKNPCNVSECPARHSPCSPPPRHTEESCSAISGTATLLSLLEDTRFPDSPDAMNSPFPAAMVGRACRNHRGPCSPCSNHPAPAHLSSRSVSSFPHGQRLSGRGQLSEQGDTGAQCSPMSRAGGRIRLKHFIDTAAC